MKEVTKHLYRIKTTGWCGVENRDSWLEWRKKHNTTPTTSTLCSYFGHGFESLNHALYERAGLGITAEAAPKQNYSTIFKDRAMEHGTNMEPLAKKAFKRFWKNYSSRNGAYPSLFIKVNDGEVSCKKTVSYGKETAKAISTPDSVYLYDYGLGESGSAVVEFKCPYKVVIERKDKTIAAVALDFKHKAPYGREAAFIQAATYCMLYQANLFYTAFYFTDTVGEEYLVVFKYSPTEEMYELIFNALRDTRHFLEEIIKCEASGGGRSYRTPTGLKRRLTEEMRVCYIESFIYDVKADILNE